MPCPQCRHENPPRAKFCLECGARLASRCSRCQAEIPAAAKFCSECGHPVGAPAAGGERYASPQVYTPRHLAEKILTSRTALEGERKQVTVLFADLKGSLEALADSDPEEARGLLDPVVDRMMEAVHRYEGTVSQVMGDGIMALFGAPLSLEDHAVRACYAALRMQDSIRRYAADVHRRMGIPLQIRVGLNSGEVVVRSINSDLRMDYTAVGQTTHLAARMEQMATPGSILVAPETLRLAEDYVIVTALGPRPVKGLEAPVEVYELTGAETVRSRLYAAAARGLTRFVGREIELEQLREALELAREGHGQVVAVVGEPGVGKSRLYWEFTHSHRTQGWLVVESGSVSYGMATPYLPVIELLKAYFHVEAQDDARRVREKVTGKVLSLDRALEPWLPAYLALLDVPTDDAQWERLDPAHRRQLTIDGLKRLLLRECQIQPVLVMFEDLHWIDAETQALLDGLVGSLPTSRLLLLVNYRPEYQHGWGSRTYYRQIRIDPLPPASAEALLLSLLGSDPSLPPLKRLLIEETEGNPFFLEESVRTLIETHALAGERGAFRLDKPVNSLAIPASARAILTARIDRLSPGDKRLLQAASVIGKDVPYALLEAVAEEGNDALREGLSHLQSSEFLYEARLFPDLEYTFKHALTHDVSYQSLVHDRRCDLHRRIMEAIERASPMRLVEHVERLAHHAFHGEVWDKAATYLRQAGLKTFAHSANRQAVAYFEQALVALGHLPESADFVGQAIDVRFDLRASLFALMDLDRALAYIREAEQIARGVDDRHRLARAWVYTSHHLLVSGDARVAQEFASKAHDLAESLGELPLRVVAKLYCGATALPLGMFKRAIEHLEGMLLLLPGALRRERCGLHGFPAAIVGHYLPWARAELGEFDAAIASGKESVQVGEAVDHAFSLATASWGLAYALVLRGDLDAALRLLERIMVLCREWSVPILLQISSGLHGIAITRAGRVEEGIDALAQARRGVEAAIGQGHYNSLHILWHGEACALGGRYAEALAAARLALDLTRRLHHRVCEGWALHLLGATMLQSGAAPADEAELHLRQALEHAQALGMRPLVARCHADLAATRMSAGGKAEAADHARLAATAYREMGMTYWLERLDSSLTATAGSA